MDNIEFNDNIFYKIIQNEAPAYKVYEDEHFLVILDAYPAALGHCLILPKEPAKDIFELSESSAMGLYPLAKKIAIAIKQATACDGINIIQNNGKVSGQAVFYFHLHVVPRFLNDDIEIKTVQHKIEKQKFEELAANLQKLVS